MVSRPQLIGTRGAVSSTHWLASAAGMEILDRGGNAFDAAAAAGFVLQVVEPHYNGAGGDVSIVLHRAGAADATSICGQAPMPAAATVDAFRSLGLAQIPASGMLPACVPGAFGAWMRLLGEFGTLHVADVLDAAIGYASNGFPLLPQVSTTIEALAPLFSSHWPTSGRTFLPDGRVPAPGSRFRNEQLGNTLRRIIAEAEAAGGSRENQIEAAHRAFYQGFVAEELDKFVAGGPVLDATGRAHAALLTGDDLADWRPQVEDALSYTYRGEYAVYKPGPWSQGPVFLQELALLDGFDLAAMRLGGAEYLHTVVECAKLAFADREAWYGDPDHTDVPIGSLLDPEYTQARRELVGHSASAELRPGSPAGRPPWIPEIPEEPPVTASEEWAHEIANGLPLAVMQATEQRGDTCHVTATDRFGNSVAATLSGGWLKSSPVIGNLGFPLSTRGQMMNLVDGHPNSVGPNKRPRTTLSPTVVLRDGAAHVAFGTPGGDRQDQWTLQFLLNVVDFGLDLQAATETVAFCTDQAPSSFTPHESRPAGMVVESDCEHEDVAELRRRGHVVELAAPRSLGKVCATGFDPENGFTSAGASPRGPQPYAVCR